DIIRYAQSLPGGRRPVAGTVLVLLRVQVFLAARPHRDVLAQLETGVNAPRRGQHRGQHGPDLERGQPAVLQVVVQDVRGVGEEVGPHVGRRGPGQLPRVLGQLLYAVAPGEVRVGL